jgi:integrase
MISERREAPMASTSSDAGGRKRILFYDLDGRRRTLRLGKTSKRAADAFRVRLERVLEARTLNQPLDRETASWVADLPDGMHNRLATFGLVTARETAPVVTLGAMLDRYFQILNVKPATRTRMEQARRAILQHFEADCDPSTITEGDAETWKAGMQADYSPATVSRTVRYARQFFRWGVRRGLVADNPFSHLPTGSQTNPDRSVYVDPETIAKVIDAAPDAEWRLLIALSRFGGLRVPSEALALRWQDVDWAGNRLTVRSPKTAHHEGKGERVVPIFPEIREHLQVVFDHAPVGADRVISKYRPGQNLNTHLRRIIQRAGLTPWPRTWHNLRASRQTELASKYPLHTVCAWIGNTKAIAAGHYLQVTDADWERAIASGEGGADARTQPAQMRAQQGCAQTRNAGNESPGSSEGAGFLRDGSDGCESLQSDPMGRGGLEPPTPAFSVPCSTN